MFPGYTACFRLIFSDPQQPCHSAAEFYSWFCSLMIEETIKSRKRHWMTFFLHLILEVSVFADKLMRSDVRARLLILNLWGRWGTDRLSGHLEPYGKSKYKVTSRLLPRKKVPINEAASSTLRNHYRQPLFCLKSSLFHFQF